MIFRADDKSSDLARESVGVRVKRLGFNVKKALQKPRIGSCADGQLVQNYIMGLKCTSKENLLNAFSLFAIRVERGGRGIRGTIEQSCSSVDTGVSCLLKCKPSYYTDASGGQFSRRRPKKKRFAMELE